MRARVYVCVCVCVKERERASLLTVIPTYEAFNIMDNKRITFDQHCCSVVSICHVCLCVRAHACVCARVRAQSCVPHVWTYVCYRAARDGNNRRAIQ